MDKKLNILVWPDTTEIGREVIRSLRNIQSITLFGANSEGDSQLCHDGFMLPNVRGAEDYSVWHKPLGQLCDANKIDWIYPCHDDVIDALACFTHVISSPFMTTRICRSKRQTYEMLSKEILVPEQYNLMRIEHYPVFVKPDKGQGTQGATLVNNRAELEAAHKRAKLYSDDPEPLIVEYLPGKEYTVDCFSDRDEGLQWCCARERLKVRNGISVKTKRVETSFNDPFVYIGPWAYIINKILPMHGAWFFQVKINANGHPVLLEVAPRIAGGAALARANGVNLPLLSIMEAEREPYTINDTREYVTLERPLMNVFLTHDGMTYGEEDCV